MNPVIPNSEYGPEWTLALTLVRTARSGFTDSMCDAFWVGEMLRRFALKNPRLTETAMSISGWELILNRQVKPTDLPISKLVIQRFFQAPEQGAEHNHWGIIPKKVPNRLEVRYRVTRILPPEVALEHLLPGYKDTEAWREFDAACTACAAQRHMLTGGEFRVITERYRVHRDKES